MAIKISGSTIIDDSRNIVAGAAATFTGNVNIEGVLTYEDVTNVDSVGLITARSGIHVIGVGSSVGIGTDNPLEALDVHGSIKVDGGPVLSKAVNYGGGHLTITSSTGYVDVGSGNASYSHFITDRPKFFFNKGLIVDEGLVASYNEDLVLATGISTERLRITSADGNVLIGGHTQGTNDSSKLSVYDSGSNIGIIQVHCGTEDAGDLAGIAFGQGGTDTTARPKTAIAAVGAGSYGRTELCFYVDGTADNNPVSTADEKLRITSAGKVGIGLTNPSAKLDVYADNTDISGIIQVTQDGTGDAAIDFQLVGTREYTLGIDNSDSDKFKLSSTAGLGNGDIITVTSGGLVGIGTDNPDTLLTLYSDAADQELIHFDMGSPDARRGWTFQQLNTGASTGLKLRASVNSKPFEIHASDDSLHFKVHTAAAPDGYVAIPVKVSIGDSIYHYGNASANIRFPADDTFSAETAGSERFRITSTGAICFGDTDNSADGYGQAGWVLTSNADAPPTWQASSGGGGGASGLWESNATGINTSTNVGIGTTTVSDASFLVDVGTASTAVVVQGSEGRLFSVTNSLSSGSIFSVNDISGIPSIDVDADGTIQLAPYGTTENVGVGTANPTSKLHVVGSVNITGVLTTGQIADSNGSVGSASSVLSSTGSGLSWVAQSGGGGGGASGLWESNTTGINTSTNVGIGTTTVSDATLVVDVGTATTAVVVQGSEGQLFSVTNSLTSGSIFSVNDISGIPSIDVDADGTIQLAPYSTTENIGIGTTNPTSKLHVVGGANITGVLTTGQIADSNGSVGTAASVLSSTGSGLSWVEQSGGASVANQADNRLISATGTTDALNAEANLTFDGTTLKVGTGITASAGIITATTFSGNATSADSATNASGLTGTPNIIVSNIVGTALSVSGIATVTDMLKVGTGITASAGIITADIIHLTGGSFGPINGGTDTKADTAIVVGENFHIYNVESSGGHLRNLIEKNSGDITIGQSNTTTIDKISLIPGKGDGRITELWAGNASASVGILTANASGVEVSGILTATTFKGDLTGTATNATNVTITDDTGDSGTHYIHFGDATSSNDGVEVNSAGLVYKDGKLGIGTNDPSSARLKVYKDGLDQVLQQWGGTQGASAGARYMELYTPSSDNANDYFRFQTGNAIKFRIDAKLPLCLHSTGTDIGMGTDAPTGAAALTNNTTRLAVGIVTTNSVYGKLNNLTYPTANGTDGYVLTSDGAGVVQWEAAPGAGGGISGITVQEEGSDLATLATTLNFVGDSVTASGTGSTKTITISGGGGGVSEALAIAYAIAL